MSQTVLLLLLLLLLHQFPRASPPYTNCCIPNTISHSLFPFIQKCIWGWEICSIERTELERERERKTKGKRYREDRQSTAQPIWSFITCLSPYLLSLFAWHSKNESKNELKMNHFHLALVRERKRLMERERERERGKEKRTILSKGIFPLSLWISSNISEFYKIYLI